MTQMLMIYTDKKISDYPFNQCHQCSKKSMFKLA